MPKAGDNIKRTDSGAWELKFKVKEIVIRDGEPHTVWRDKTRRFETRGEALTFKSELRAASAKGEVWRDQRLDVGATFALVVEKYNDAAKNAPKGTRAARASNIKSWLDYVGADTQVTAWSLGTLEAFAASLPAEGRKASTRHRKVLEVEAMWRWARARPELFPGVPEPRPITGSGAGEVRPPPPVVRLAAPTIADVDAMIGALRSGYEYGDLHRRIAVFLRYTGLRIGQVIGLLWHDLRLDGVNGSGPYLIVKAGRAGAKLGRGRAIPLHPGLVAEIRSWRSAREGLVFSPLDAGPYWHRGEATRVAFITAWKKSGVPLEKWHVTPGEVEAGERAHGSPCHAIRAAVKVHMLAAEVRDSIVDFFIGHTKGSTSEAYVPEHDPASSPYWKPLQRAVLTIPDHRPASPLLDHRATAEA